MATGGDFYMAIDTYLGHMSRYLMIHNGETTDTADMTLGKQAGVFGEWAAASVRVASQLLIVA